MLPVYVHGSNNKVSVKDAGMEKTFLLHATTEMLVKLKGLKSMEDQYYNTHN